ncbi:MAG: GNAT family acetyltransferase [Candidatus Eisenbacteria bacterium]
MNVRPYEDSDEREVVSLWDEVFPDAPSWNDPATDIARKAKVQRELFLVAELDGRVAGTAMGGYDGHRAWVYYVVVSPGARRRGVGTALMREIERLLRETGAGKLNLQVRAGNDGAVAFYDSLGYAVEDRVSMGKRLTGP